MSEKTRRQDSHYKRGSRRDHQRSGGRSNGHHHSSQVGSDTLTVGKVKWFNATKGYGFIVGPEDGKDIFFHHTHIEMSGYRTVNPDQEVAYRTIQTGKGIQAIHVRPL